MGRKEPENHRNPLPGPAQPARTTVIEGAKRSIAYARMVDGSEPAKAFYEGLDARDRAKFDALFASMAEYGLIRNDEKFHPKVHIIRCDHDGAISEFPVGEFKVHSGAGKRIMACLHGRVWVLTHGFAKGAKVWIEGAKAQRIFCADLSRLPK